MGLDSGVGVGVGLGPVVGVGVAVGVKVGVGLGPSVGVGVTDGVTVGCSSQVVEVISAARRQYLVPPAVGAGGKQYAGGMT